MSDSTLTTEQTLALLLELAVNDGFRRRFADKPAAALVELGVPHETVINLNAQCLAPMRLADAADFRKAHDDYAKAAVVTPQSMIIPNHLRFAPGTV
jgi:putative modified peptide